jgi:hypothetical protein
MTDDDRTPVPIRPTGPRPLGGLADLAELLAGETPNSKRFLRGLVAGALVGATLAGSSLLRRRRRTGGGSGVTETGDGPPARTR